MDIKEFKRIIDRIANKNKFEKAFNGWYKSSDESIITINLQKSSYGKNYYMNLKIYIQGIFAKQYVVTKELIKDDTGDIFLRQAKEYDLLFDLENTINQQERELRLEEMFKNYVIPITVKALRRDGIIELYREQKIFLLPAIKEYLKIDD